MNYLKMLAFSYQQTGRHEEANALLNRCLILVAGARESGWATPILHVRLAEVYVLLGDLANSIANLEIAFNKGWRGVNTIETGLFWQGVQAEPDLEQIKVLIYEDLEIQRKKLQEAPDNTQQPLTNTYTYNATHNKPNSSAETSWL
jgi:hypothetical protein